MLFDVDGTLVDTTYLHAICWAEALRQYGDACPMSVVHRAIGMGSAELLDHLLGADRSEQDRAQDAARRAAHLTLYKQHWGRLTPLPGAAELVRTCAARGLRTVLASSASEEELAALRAVLDADDAIDVATSSDDADAGKPEPDILQAALTAADLTPERAVFVGDAVWDAAAAARTGLRFVGVTSGGTSAAELREAGAVEVWRDAAELVTNWDESIVGRLTG